MKRSLKFLSVLFSITLILQLIPMSHVYAESNVWEVRTDEEFVKAMNEINDGSSGKSIISLQEDIDIHTIIPALKKDTTILGNGHTINLGPYADLIMNSGATLSLGSPDHSLEENRLVIKRNLTPDDKPQYNNPMIAIGDYKVSEGVLNIYDGVKLTGGVSSGGQPTAVSIRNGTFNMYGGEITDNYTYAINFIGAAVGGYGGHTSRETKVIVNMYGGKIYNNHTYRENNNTSEIYGGGIFVLNGDINIEGGEISNNIMETSAGYKVKGGGIMLSGGNLSINNAIIKGNKADEGAGIYAYSTTVNIGENTIIESNEATDFGAGIFMNKSTLLIDGNVKIQKNRASEVAGIYTYGSKTIIRNGVEIDDNIAEKSCGGIFGMKSDIELTDNVKIRRNEAAEGGAIYFRDTTATIGSDVLIADNSVSKFGGGMYLWDTDAKISSEAKIYNNSALTGGGILTIGDKGNLSVEKGAYIANNIATAKGSDIAYYGAAISLPSAKDMKASLITDGSNKDIDGWYNDEKGWDPETASEVDHTNITANAFLKAAYYTGVVVHVNKVWSDNSTDKEVTIKLLKKKAPIVIVPEVEDRDEEVIYIGVRSMPDVAGTLSTSNDVSEMEGTTEGEIPEGYEFVKGEDGDPKTLTLNASNNYQGVFEKLPKYEKDGKTLIEYKVYEVKVEGYTTSISGNQEEGFVVTNTKIAPKKFEVTFMNGNTEYARVEAEKDNSINNDSLTEQSMPTSPSKAEHTFKEWNTKADGSGAVFTGDTVVTENMTVYAIYNKVEKPIVNPDPNPTPTPNPEPKPNVNIVPKKPVKDKTLPKTGDATNILSYALLLGLSGSILLGFAVRKKKINK